MAPFKVIVLAATFITLVADTGILKATFQTYQVAPYLTTLLVMVVLNANVEAEAICSALVIVVPVTAVIRSNLVTLSP